ncbi:MAG: hypothetical protein JWO36_5462 [Myxococcales bacterium]|nr:hypothetical protein [Myxococcales bacterium]
MWSVPAIDRIPPCSPQFLLDNYVIPQKPVIITGMLSHLPFHGSFDQVMERFTEIQFEHKGAGHYHTMEERNLGEWLARYRAGEPVKDGKEVWIPKLGAQCAPELMAGLHTAIDRRSIELMGGHRCFFAAPGGITDLHCDGWTIGSLQYHVAGRKEWFLAPPQASAALGPIGYGYLVRPFHMPPAQRAQLAEQVDGYWFTVEPGETLFWPQQWVHGCFYPEPSFAIVDQFGTTPYSLFLAREVPRCFLRHCVQQKLTIYATERDYLPEFLQLHAATKQTYGSPLERFLAIERVLRGLYDRLFPELPIEKQPFDFEAVRSLEEDEGVRWLASQANRDQNWDKITNALPRYDWWQADASSATA